MQISSIDLGYVNSRHCLRDPIPEIFEAARFLAEAANAHVQNNPSRAKRLLNEADIPVIRDWIESLWGSRKLYPNKVHYLRIRDVSNLEVSLAKEARVPTRAPTVDVGNQIIDKYGWHCAYCRIPLISRKARNVLLHAYAEDVRWGRTNDEKHTAFMCMDNEFDHVLPHSRGGTNDPENLVPCCAPCNCGKENFTLAQLGLFDPRDRDLEQSEWDGLTRLH